MIEGWGLAAAAVVGAGAIGGAIISSNGAQSAAQTSANASTNATQAQLGMFNTTQANYAPQIALGQGAANMLSGIYGLGGNVTAGSSAAAAGYPIASTPTTSSGYSAFRGGTVNPSMSGNASGPGALLGAAPSSTPASSPAQPNPNYAAFYNTPGYQFTLNQGLNAVNRQAASNGSLYSSNTLGALNNYAQGAASTQYNSYINQLLSMAGLGNAAASGVGSAATATGAGMASSIQNGGNAGAAGILGSANAFSSALGQGGSLLGNYFNGNSSNNGYMTNGGYVYNGVEQNGGMGGGIGNIVGNVDGP